MLNWEMEFKKWAPAFKILTYYGNQKERKQKRTVRYLLIIEITTLVNLFCKLIVKNSNYRINDVYRAGPRRMHFTYASLLIN